ncbi:MAG: bifunctional alpha,alpha-trehalose-phosphate synthase (UDP-forming)/trehalose-phosphatase [Planctomycetes bacterium]|nr:bifunctional alpha,alpha-trehalose-phosphate synthase (UDP-forming)/trehalose-phosphatase [Planctomycetota bacterium]
MSDPIRQRPLVVASNRLPVSLRWEEGALRTERSAGGLVAAVEGVAARSRLGEGGGFGFDWVGWPGAPVAEAQRDEVRSALAASRLHPVFLDAEDEALHYRGIANETLWPLFHYFADKSTFSAAAWQRYVEVNQRFTNAILAIAPEDARVWVHDFHLMLVPRMLREAREDLEISFFLHVPFPASEVYRLLPAREELLTGVLGADLIGFHTIDYARHFLTSCVRILGLEVAHDSVQFEGRRVEVGVHPIGIDVHRFDALLDSEAVATRLAELRTRYAGRRLVLGVERLDYTKGIAHKLRAFERLLERRADLRDQLTLLQVIVPSRLDSDEYAGLKRELEEHVGRINGRFGQPGNTPVEYLHRSLDPVELTALYRFADVGMVTPLRDGMNLVAQEYVLCQEPRERLGDACRGMLVLSEFAGAAHVLPRALLVNPWHVESTADALEAALAMAEEERRERIGAMAERVRGLECTAWAERFLARSAEANARNRRRSSIPLRGAEEQRLRECFARAPRRFLLLDYDGTLRELERTPLDARPDQALRELLRALARDERTQVHVVSGRRRRELERWLGDLGVHLSAEHGFASRPAGSAEWREPEGIDLSWLPAVDEVLARVCDEVPGTTLERKPSALAWHYRLADTEYGPWRARELLSELTTALARLPVEVIHGVRVVEVRAAGVHKGVYVARVVADAGPSDFILGIGDDRTDRDLFRALPEHAFAVHVGRGDEDARFRIESPARVRALLSRLLRPNQDAQPASQSR